jgi:hypothetical protein
MHKLEFSRPAVVIALGLALFALHPVPAQTPATSAPAPAPAAAPTPDPASRAALESDAVKAVEARKQRCRLHPGTCARGGERKPVPPKPAQTR